MVCGDQDEITQGQDLNVRLSILGFCEVPKIPSADGGVFIYLVTIVKEHREKMRKAITSRKKICHLLFVSWISHLGHLILCNK